MTKLHVVGASVALLAVCGVIAWCFVLRSDPSYDERKRIEALIQSPPTSIEVPADISLPRVRVGKTLNPRDLVLVISTHEMRFPISRLTLEISDDASAGLLPRYKDGLYVRELGSALAWASDAGIYPPQTNRTVTVLADRDVPYRVLREVLFTSTKRGWHWSITGQQGNLVVGVATGPLKPPRHGLGPNMPALSTVIVITDDGFSIHALGKTIAPSCDAQDGGTSLTIARYDYAALARCVAGLKALSPYFQEELDIAIDPGPQIPQHVLVSTIEAVGYMGEDGPPLFPNARLVGTDEATW